MVTGRACGYYYGIIVSHSYDYLVKLSNRKHNVPSRILADALRVILTIKIITAQINFTTHPYPNT